MTVRLQVPDKIMVLTWVNFNEGGNWFKWRPRLTLWFTNIIDDPTQGVQHHLVPRVILMWFIDNN